MGKAVDLDAGLGSKKKFNVFDPGIIDNPYPIYAEMRQEAPVYFDENFGFWILTRYEDVLAVLRNPKFSSKRVDSVISRFKEEERPSLEQVRQHMSLWMVFNDPPAHTRIRNLVAKAFSPKLIKTLRPQIEELTDELIAEISRKPQFDLMADFAVKLPLRVIGRMLGVKPEFDGMLKKCSDEMTNFLFNFHMNADGARNSQKHIIAMAEVFRKLIAERKNDPKDDFLGDLISAQESGQVLNEDELVATCCFVLAAGHETTAHLIGNGILTLLKHPEELARLQKDPKLINSAVEEILRYESPVNTVSRIASEDISIGKYTIKKGQRALCLLSAANRDPQRFPVPNKFDITRDSHHHLAFGMGIHYCPGGPLSRLEAEIGMGRLIARFPLMKLADAKLSWANTFGFRGLRSLNIQTGENTGIQNPALYKQWTF